MDTYKGTLLSVIKGVWLLGYFVEVKLDKDGEDEKVRFQLIDDREEVIEVLHEQMLGMVGHHILVTATNEGVNEEKIPIGKCVHISVLGNGKTLMDKVIEASMERENVGFSKTVRPGKGWETLETWLRAMAEVTHMRTKGSSKFILDGVGEWEAQLVDGIGMLDVELQFPKGLVKFESVEMKGGGFKELATQNVVFHFMSPLEAEAMDGVPEDYAARIPIGHTECGGSGTFHWDANAQERMTPHLRTPPQPVSDEEHQRNLQRTEQAVSGELVTPPSSIKEALAEASVRSLTNR